MIPPPGLQIYLRALVTLKLDLLTPKVEPFHALDLLIPKVDRFMHLIC